MAAAKAELDGLRRPQRPLNPLTIIQIKNAERNVDDTQHGCLWHLGLYRMLTFRSSRLCFTASLALGLVMVGVMVWASPDNCHNQMICLEEPSAMPNRHRRNAQWVISYDNISKFVPERYAR